VGRLRDPASARPLGLAGRATGRRRTSCREGSWVRPEEGRRVRERLAREPFPGLRGGRAPLDGGRPRPLDPAALRAPPLSDASHLAMTTPATLPNGKTLSYGFGLGVDSFAGRRRYFHGGGLPGFDAWRHTFPARTSRSPSSATPTATSRWKSPTRWPASSSAPPTQKRSARARDFRLPSRDGRAPGPGQPGGKSRSCRNGRASFPE